MDRRQIAALLTLKKLGIEPDLTTFSGRLVAQKVLYLVQAAKLDLGYFYSWYLRGPYSPDVSRDLFPAIDELKANPNALVGWKLDSSADPVLDQIQTLVPARPDEDRSSELELLASVHFLVERRGLAHDPSLLSEEMRKYNKNFTSGEVSSGLDALRRAHLL